MRIPIVTASELTPTSPPKGSPLQRLLWRSYIRTALIPLFVIELSFLAIYWIGEGIIYDKNVEAVSDVSERYFRDIAQREASTINAELETIASHTRVYASQTLSALEGNYVPPEAERERYRLRPEGGLFTAYDVGTSASFYSASTDIGQKEMGKVWKLSALDPLMMAIKNSNNDISSIYFNTYDNYNRIYPYIDVKTQYDESMDITSYNFYYEADETHNPDRRDVWTDAYVDPAGHGWMVSSIAPVWRGDQLEGVVGIDITLKTIIDNLLKLDLPWGGYAILVDDSGGIIALPPAGEADFGLSELTEHDYAAVILSDTFKPESFNINRREDTKALAQAMQELSSGSVELDLDGRRLASFAVIPQTNWRLVIVAPSQMILADAQTLHDRLELIGLTMLAILVAFYAVFFAFLLRRASLMSQLIAKPLTEVADLIDHIDDRTTQPRFAGSEIEELNQLGEHLITTRARLFQAEDETLRQSSKAREALQQLRTANGEMVNFSRTMSHEIRTPLSIISGTAQIIQRKAEILSPDDLQKRADRLRKSVAKIANLLTGLVSRFDEIALEVEIQERSELASLSSEVAKICSDAIPASRLKLVVPNENILLVKGAAALLVALRQILSNTVQHADPARPVAITLSAGKTDVMVVVASSMPKNEPSIEGVATSQPIGASRSGNGNSMMTNSEIARKVIEDAGGKIVEEFASGKRTTTLTIPLERSVS